MKLGFLALNRLNKNVKIISEKKIFDFYIGKDNNFIQDNKSLNCLFCKISQYNKEDMKDKIKVEIENVKLNEWKEQIINYLWLLKGFKEIYLVFQYNQIIGEILLDSELNNKIYCKGIFVQKNKKITEKQYINTPGFNIFDLELDRDRNYIQDLYTKNKISSKILTYFINNNNKELFEKLNEEKYHSLKSSKSEFFILKKANIIQKKHYYKLPSYIIELLKNYENYEVSDIVDYQTFTINLSKEGADYFWEEINKDEQYNGKQPVSDISKVNEFIEQYNLPKDFYPCFQSNKELEVV